MSTTLVVGGTGKTGRRVAQRLRQRGLPVRVGSRSGEPRFDWDDQATWAGALRDVASVYLTYYPDLAFPGASGKIASFAKLAAERGIGRLVLLSGRGEEGAQRCEAFLAGLFSTVFDGRNAHLADGIQHAMGRPPRDLATFARDAAAAGAWTRS